MPGGGEDIAKLLAKRARLRKVHCARQIQRQARMWLARLRRQYAFVDKVCRPGGIYEQGRLRAVVAAWRNFADDEDVRWSKGVAFFGYRAGYLWQDGNRDMKERRFVVFHDHIDIVDANTDKKVWSIEYNKVRRVSKGVEHKKHDVTVDLRTGHRDVYKLLNPIGFVAAFQFNMMKWVHREERKHDRQRGKARHEEIFQEDRVSGEPEIEEFRPDPAPPLPGSAERSEASGEDVVDLVPPLRLACQSGLDKSGLFGPIQRPWKDDWIGLRPEARTQSQRYQDWKAMDPRIPFGSNRSHIFLVAIGDLEPFNGGCELRCLADFARAYFHGIRVTTLPPIPLRGLHRDRGMRLDMKLTGFETEEACKNTSVPIQLPEIERYLRKLLPTNAFVLIGITLHEVSGGEGYTRGSPYMTLPEMREHANRKRVCVLSLSRLDPWYRRNPTRDPHIQDSRETRKTLLLRRACKWLAHHAMLLFDMDHCVYHGCLMNGFAHLEEMGFVPLQICPICLRKLLDAIGIKTSVRCIERYRSLRRFCHVNQTVFSRDRAWYAVRIASLEKALLRHQTTMELERLFGASSSAPDARSSLPRLDVRT